MPDQKNAPHTQLFGCGINIGIYDGENCRGEERYFGLAIVPKVNYCEFKISPRIPNNSQKAVGDGLEAILNHFQEPFWPRTIATKTTEGRQVLVNNKEEAVARYEAANWLDCRISAYPPNATENRSELERFLGIPTIDTDEYYNNDRPRSEQFQD